MVRYSSPPLILVPFHSQYLCLLFTSSASVYPGVLKRGRSGVCLGFAFPAGGLGSSQAVQIQNPKPILSQRSSPEAVNSEYEAQFEGLS